MQSILTIHIVTLDLHKKSKSTRIKLQNRNNRRSKSCITIHCMGKQLVEINNQEPKVFLHCMFSFPSPTDLTCFTSLYHYVHSYKRTWPMLVITFFCEQSVSHHSHSSPTYIYNQWSTFNHKNPSWPSHSTPIIKQSNQLWQLDFSTTHNYKENYTHTNNSIPYVHNNNQYIKHPATMKTQK